MFTALSKSHFVLEILRSVLYVIDIPLTSHPIMTCWKIMNIFESHEYLQYYLVRTLEVTLLNNV